MSTEKLVINAICRYAVIDRVVGIERSHHLRDDLGLDSHDMMELWIDLERKFNIEIPEEMIDGLTDVQSVIDAVDNNLSAFTNKK